MAVSLEFIVQAKLLNGWNIIVRTEDKTKAAQLFRDYQAPSDDCTAVQLIAGVAIDRKLDWHIIAERDYTPSDMAPASAKIRWFYWQDVRTGLALGIVIFGVVIWWPGDRSPDETMASVTIVLSAEPESTQVTRQPAAPHEISDKIWALRLLANQGDPKAQNDIGTYYESGLGVPQDLVEAASWYRKAATSGEVHAETNLGRLYANGRGVTQDYGQALKWLSAAADLGSGDAQTRLGVLYTNGQGVPRNYVSGFKWFQSAAAQGSIQAQLNIGIMYGSGLGLKRDYAKAAAWVRKAADLGSAQAAVYLAALYVHGRGVPKDDGQALKWYRLAADRGDAEAVTILNNLTNTAARMP